MVAGDPATTGRRDHLINGNSGHPHAYAAPSGRHHMSQGRPYVSHLTLADTPNAVPWARRHTADILRRWRIPDAVIETANLIVSELTTNAIRHPANDQLQSTGYPSLAGVGTFTLGLLLTGTGLLVQVADRDPRPPARREVGVEATGGRGLFLVSEMTNRWGYYPTTTAGKVVWAELLLHGPGRSGSGHTEQADERTQPAEASGPVPDPLLIGRVLVGLREL
ncbi:ATP-binding protein [Kitasatospora sp. NPDC088783]|uniref:ATP-binding protein n=1 Tax=Kitasatospora sp. NPDC088783 TaxID=3364077 RepID=UPI0037F649A8